MKALVKHKYFWHVIIVLVIVIVLYFTINGIHKKRVYEALMEVIKNPATATGTAEDLIHDPGFDEKYWETRQAELQKGFNATTYVSAATVIYDAKGIFSDNETAAVSEIAKMKSKAQLSYLSAVFNRKYNRRLIDYLKSFMSSANMDEIASIVKRLK